MKLKDFAPRNVPRSDPSPLKVWPKAPGGFSKAERAAWNDLGRALLPLGTVSAADLIMVTLTARVVARVEVAIHQRGVRLSMVTAMTRLASDLLRSLGLSPSARAQVRPLNGRAPAGPREHDPLQEFIQ